ncbi:MAG: rRNA maturation RNase YbeY [Candidatus Dojkabacteria bacterium]|nr:MAG: rRNA maturation RNase YbeY [Candidatus Dojkabacteria bacterium]
MEFSYTVATSVQKEFVQRVLSFFSTPQCLQELNKCPVLQEKAHKHRIEISVVSPAQMAQVNAAYRGKNVPTDVLSFELFENGLMGELYLCPLEIQKNAEFLGHSFERELIEITIHGLLHLSGYDHSDDMFQWQEKLTNSLVKMYETTGRTG